MAAPAHNGPALTAELKAHADDVRAHIIARTHDAGGFLPFDVFMHEALYAPALGYYVAGLRKFGRDGDFVTAPEVSPLFGRVIARNCAPILDALQTSTIVEYGPGSGALADAVIGWFAERERSLDYRLVEVSPDLAARQRARLEHWTQQPQITLDWFDDPTTQTIRGVVLGNEVADALPVRRFRRTATGFDELGLAADGDALRIAERSAPSTVAADLAALEQRRGSPFPPGYTSEYCPALANWVTAVVRTVDAGLVLLCDYGAGASEYYADERYDGTFRCHFRHQAIDDPLFAPGLVDMTAWVDFTTLAEAGVAAGSTLTGFTTQAGFLLGGGLTDECRGDLSADEQLRQAAALKTLTLPGEMGERFRFIGFERGTLPPVAGFGFQDLRYSL